MEPASVGTGSQIDTGKFKSFAWVDLLKAVALLWIFANHSVEQLFDGPLFFNPSSSWPPVDVQMEQLRPIAGEGLSSLLINAARYLGWLGDNGVQLFLIVSGFGLTWGLLQKYGNTPLPLKEFYRKRFERIYPLWWGVHLLMIPVALLTGIVWFGKLDFLLSALGFRLTSHLLYFISPAWWYIGLTIQLYLVYPLLWAFLRRWGIARFALVTIVLGVLIRWAGLFYFDYYLEAWSRGAIFITRLPEFAIGITLAAWMKQDSTGCERWLRFPRGSLLGILLLFAGISCSFTLSGMAVAFVLVGAGAFLILYSPLEILGRFDNKLTHTLSWIGRHSYSLFLVHHLCVLAFVPAGLTMGWRRISLGLLCAVIASVVVALCLEKSVEAVQRRIRMLRSPGQWLHAIGRFLVYGIVVIVLLLASEILSRQLVPQEAEGWGERPSLEPYHRFGWRLIPNKQTRLRWEHYDYMVKSNSLGFPGPEYEIDKPPGAIRIMTTGDAFTSAEGVNTEDAWPRLLEQQLSDSVPDAKFQVLNFAITAYGPRQYATVIDSFAPLYHPDIILLEMFVNDFQDAVSNQEEVCRSIGFDSEPFDSWRNYVRMVNVRRYIKDKISDPLVADLRSLPSPPYGYFLGNFAALRKRAPAEENEARTLVYAFLSRIKNTAESAGARLAILMVPASVQVCNPADLDYYPRHVDLNDTTKYDMDGPQRSLQSIADSLGIRFVDLREAFESNKAHRLYHPNNMHWTLQGHQFMARFVSRLLREDKYLGSAVPQ